MLKKRMPTPKTGPKGRAYDLAHRAWRAGCIDGWHLMEDGTWSLKVAGGRDDGLTVDRFTAMVETTCAMAGVDAIEWAESTWLGRREVIVRRVNRGVEVPAHPGSVSAVRVNELVRLAMAREETAA